MRRPVVVVVCRYVPQYRARFFDLLRDSLTERGIDLRLVYGLPGPKDASKGDAVEPGWAVKTSTVTVRVGGRPLYWQRCLRLVRDADLVIVEQASKLLANYVLLAWQWLGGPLLGLWGHGVNLKKAEASAIGEAVKRGVSRRAAWWFAYTVDTGDAVCRLGFPAERVTVVQNAIDTHTLVTEGLRLRATDAGRDEVQALRRSLAIRGEHVGLFVGALYEQKRLPFLVDVCELIRRHLPDFEMVVVGGGPQRDIIDAAAAHYPWFHAVGPVFGAARVPYFVIADLVLMPGAVGLGVLDSFALETPLVTTSGSCHGPEATYLRDGVNAVMLPERCTPQEYADQVVALLHDRQRLDRLRLGCREARDCYTVEEMVQRFATGVEKALRAPGVA